MKIRSLLYFNLIPLCALFFGTCSEGFAQISNSTVYKWNFADQPYNISALKIMPNGDMYIAIEADGSNCGSQDFQPGAGVLTPSPQYNICKYATTATGATLVWGIFISVPILYDIDVDNFGNLFVVGYNSAPGSDFDPGPGVVNLPYSFGEGKSGYIAKYDAATGEYLDAWNINTVNNDAAIRVKVSQGGDIFISGYMNLGPFHEILPNGSESPQSIDLDRRVGYDYFSASSGSFLIKYNSSGVFQWKKDLSEPVSDIEFDGMGNAIVVYRQTGGALAGYGGFHPTYIEKYDFYGATVGSTYLGDFVLMNNYTNSRNEYTILDKDGLGYLYFTGQNSSGVNQLIKLDPNLVIQWNKTIGTSALCMGNIQYDGGCRIYFTSGNITTSNVDINPDAGTNNVSSSSEFLASYSTSTGALQTIDVFTGNSSSKPTSSCHFSVQFNALGEIFYFVEPLSTTNADYNVAVLGTNKAAFAAGSCSNNALVKLTIPTAAKKPTISGPSAICPGETATITATGANSYSWSPVGSSSPSVSVSPLATTTYTVTVDVGGSCPVGSVQMQHTIFVDCVLLPVEIVDFKGENIASLTNRLYWSVGNEGEYHSFLLERSYNHKDQMNWDIIGLISSEDENHNTTYSFLDDKLLSDSIRYYGTIVYYRLSQVDENNDKQESGLIAVEMEGGTEVEIYPNPSFEAITIDIPANNTSVSVYNSWGQCIYYAKGLAKGSYRIDEKFAAGFYQLQINSETGQVQHKSFLRL